MKLTTNTIDALLIQLKCRQCLTDTILKQQIPASARPKNFKPVHPPLPDHAGSIPEVMVINFLIMVSGHCLFVELCSSKKVFSLVIYSIAKR